VTALGKGGGGGGGGGGLGRGEGQGGKVKGGRGRGVSYPPTISASNSSRTISSWSALLIPYLSCHSSDSLSRASMCPSIINLL